MLAQLAKDKAAASGAGQQSRTVASASKQVTQIIHPSSKESPIKPPNKKWANTTADTRSAKKGKDVPPFKPVLLNFNGGDILAKASSFHNGELAGKLLLVGTLPEDYDTAAKMDGAKSRESPLCYTNKVGHLSCTL